MRIPALHIHQILFNRMIFRIQDQSLGSADRDRLCQLQSSLNILISCPRDDRPSFSASDAEKFLAVYASSRSKNWLPVSFGRYVKDLTSASNPISDSCVDTSCIDSYPVLETIREVTLMLKVLFSATCLTSRAHIMSTPSPTTELWVATITGKGALSVIAVWNFRINLCTARDVRAPSCFIGKTCAKLGIDVPLTT